MSTLVDFQQQRKRSKVYPQLNFLLLRKIAPELRLLYVYVGVCACVGCMCVCDRPYVTYTLKHMYARMFPCSLPAPSSFVVLTFNSTCLNFHSKFIVVFVVVAFGTFLAISALGNTEKTQKTPYMNFSKLRLLLSDTKRDREEHGIFLL